MCKNRRALEQFYNILLNSVNMNNKAVAVIASAVVVAALAASAICVLCDDTTYSDYTLVGADDRLVENLTIKSSFDMPKGKGTGLIVVDSVSNGIVRSHEITTILSGTVMSLSSFMPGAENEYLPFDYTNEEEIIDAGATMVHDGNNYNLKWKLKEGKSDSTFEIDIVYDGHSVSSVTGKGIDILHESTDTSVTVTTTDYGFSTTGSKVAVTEKQTGETKYAEKVSEFYASHFTKYHEETYKDVAEKSTERFGNITVNLYTLNGTVRGEDPISGDITDIIYEDYVIFTYHGYILMQSGVMNGESVNTSLEIYIA